MQSAQFQARLHLILCTSANLIVRLKMSELLSVACLAKCNYSGQPWVWDWKEFKRVGYQKWNRCGKLEDRQAEEQIAQLEAGDGSIIKKGDHSPWINLVATGSAPCHRM